MTHIQLEDVLPSAFGRQGVLDSDVWGTRLSLKASQFYQLWAPSGRGKTTFLHLLYGLRRDYTGSLKIGEATAGQLTGDQWAELRQFQLSIVFQDLRLFPDLTGLENVRVKHVLEPHLTEKELLELCRELGIESLLDKCCGKMSFGEQQRVAIVRAMAQPFSWLLLDEPFSHLDADNIAKACRLIARQCHQRNAGCLIMTLDTHPYLDESQLLRL